jgi:D-serine deaminase-like pyridoxal phosphate-dependent protein
VEIASRQVGDHFGGITVSTLAEARYFGKAGYSDITWALPVPLPRITEAIELGRQIGRLSLLVDSVAAVDALAREAGQMGAIVPVFLKVDCGYGRAGVVPGTMTARQTAMALHDARALDFRGLLTHGGHSYDCTSRDEIAKVALQERSSVVGLAEALRSAGVPIPEVSVGSTPTMSVVQDLTGVTEIRPGNYAVFDRFQASIGSCDLEDVAVTVLATVIGKYPDRVVLDAGATALSKDPGPVHIDPECGFGLIRTIDMEPIVDLRLVGLSQEHAKVKGGGVEKLVLGQQVRIVPNHSCLAIGCHDLVHVVRGQEVVDAWIPCRGW